VHGTTVKTKLTCLYGVIDILIGSLKKQWTEIEYEKS